MGQWQEKEKARGRERMARTKERKERKGRKESRLLKPRQRVLVQWWSQQERKSRLMTMTTVTMHLPRRRPRLRPWTIPTTALELRKSTSVTLLVNVVQPCRTELGGMQRWFEMKKHAFLSCIPPNLLSALNLQ